MEQWSAPQKVIIGDEHKSQSLCILYDMFKRASYRPDLDYWMTLSSYFLHGKYCELQAEHSKK